MNHSSPGLAENDELLAFLLQKEEFDKLVSSGPIPWISTQDKQYIDTRDSILIEDEEEYHHKEDDHMKSNIKNARESFFPGKEQNDEILDIHDLFVFYNDLYFEGKLGAVTVEWSKKMTLCAGLCYWKNGDCRIKLSSKLLQYRSNKELKETLLHECIHAYLFVTHNNKDRDGHGPEFLKKMNEINQKGNFNISVYHSFHDEVNHFRQHWWQCTKCRYIVKRAMNRAPGKSDWWWENHRIQCGGEYIKIKEPPQSNQKKESKKRKRSEMTSDPETGRSNEENKPTKKAKRNEIVNFFDKWKQNNESEAEKKIDYTSHVETKVQECCKKKQECKVSDNLIIVESSSDEDEEQQHKEQQKANEKESFKSKTEKVELDDDDDDSWLYHSYDDLKLK